MDGRNLFVFYQISTNRIKIEPTDNTLSEQFKSQIRKQSFSNMYLYSRLCEPFQSGLKQIFKIKTLFHTKKKKSIGYTIQLFYIAMYSYSCKYLTKYPTYVELETLLHFFKRKIVIYKMLNAITFFCVSYHIFDIYFPPGILNIVVCLSRYKTGPLCLL